MVRIASCWTVSSSSLIIVHQFPREISSDSAAEELVQSEETIYLENCFKFLLRYHLHTVSDQLQQRTFYTQSSGDAFKVTKVKLGKSYEIEIIRTINCLQRVNQLKYLPSKQYKCIIFFFLRNCSLQPFHIFLLEKLPSKTHFKSHSIYNQDLKFRYVATGCKSK